MTINVSNGCAPFVFPCTHDKDSKVFYTMTYRPKEWEADKDYTQDVDIVIPATPMGMVFVTKSGGISQGPDEPSWVAVEGKDTVDGTVLWTAQAYDYLLKYGDVITESTWSGEAGVVFDFESIIGGIQTEARLVAVPAGATVVTLINHVKITRLGGKMEEKDRSIILPISDH